MPLIVGFRAFLSFEISWTLVLWYFNTSAQSAAASVVGGKHATTACELGTPTTAEKFFAQMEDQQRQIPSKNNFIRYYFIHF